MLRLRTETPNSLFQVSQLLACDNDPDRNPIYTFDLTFDVTRVLARPNGFRLPNQPVTFAIEHGILPLTHASAQRQVFMTTIFILCIGEEILRS